MTDQYHQAYQQLEQSLQQFQTALATAATPPVELRTTVLQMQQRFQLQILPLTATVAATEQRNRIDALQIEINKQLRLLETDTLFLQAARQPDTAQQRKQQMQSRLEMLSRYCTAILTLVAGVENGSV